MSAVLYLQYSLLTVRPYYNYWCILNDPGFGLVYHVLGLGLETQILGLGLEGQVLGLGLEGQFLGLGLEGQVLGLGLGLCVLDSNTASLCEI